MNQASGDGVEFGNPERGPVAALRCGTGHAVKIVELGWPLRAAGLVVSRRVGKDVHYQRTQAGETLIRAAAR